MLLSQGEVLPTPGRGVTTSRANCYQPRANRDCGGEGEVWLGRSVIIPNRNSSKVSRKVCSKVSRKVCSKWLSLHKQCHKHAQRVKMVYSRATQKSNQASLTMLHKQVNVNHSHLTTTRNNKFLIPHSKTKHHMNSFFPRGTTLERTTGWD